MKDMPAKPKSAAPKKKAEKRKPSEYNKFVSGLMKEGKTMAQAAKLWKEKKGKA